MHIYIYIETKTQNTLSESAVSNNNMNADLFNKCNIMQIWLYSHVYMQYIVIIWQFYMQCLNYFLLHSSHNGTYDPY
jgi:hypothetical protein